ncbi:MAG: DUF4215 domain-containing protein [Myxococcota bacterium]
MVSIDRIATTHLRVFLLLGACGPLGCFSEPLEPAGAEDGEGSSAADDDGSSGTTTGPASTDGTGDGGTSTTGGDASGSGESSESSTGAPGTGADSGSSSSGGRAVPVCGDGIVDGTEECDDGNEVANDGCEASCVTTGVAQVSVGRSHACVVTRAGTVRCFGQSTHGQLGYGDLETIGDDEPPYEAGDVDTGDVPVVSVGAGIRHTCALLEDKTVMCWGDGQSGRLGYGNLDDVGDDESPASVGVVDLGGPVERLAVGHQHNCALMEDGGVRCWGLNFEGVVLGYGDIGNVGDDEAPADVGDVPFGGTTIVQLSAGFTHTCALSDEGEVFCWGTGADGKLGLASIDPLPMPAGVAVDLGGDAQAVLAGTVTSCARMADDDVYCWGRGDFFTLGNQNTDDVGDDEIASATGEIPLGFNVRQVVGEGFHQCALSDDDAVHCWGNALYGRLGLGNTDTIGNDEDPGDAPAVSVGGPVVQLSADIESTCALRDDHQLVCWGRNDDARLGHSGGGNIGDDELPSDVGPVPLFAP